MAGITEKGTKQTLPSAALRKTVSAEFLPCMENQPFLINFG
jgi:hypothetical protein